MDFQLPLQQTELKAAKINFRATLKELYDLSYLMTDTENAKNHTKTINLMVRQIKQNIEGSKILLERNSPRKRKLLKLKTVKKKIKRLKSEPKQLFNKNIKHPYSNRVSYPVGERNEMMRQLYRAKIYIKQERSKSTAGTETCSIENSHPIVTDDPCAENNVPVTHGVTPSMEQQLTAQTDLDNETINLALKYLRKQYPLCKGFEVTTVGYTGNFSKHDGNFYQIVYVNHH